MTAASQRGHDCDAAPAGTSVGDDPDHRRLTTRAFVALVVVCLTLGAAPIGPAVAAGSGAPETADEIVRSAGPAPADSPSAVSADSQIPRPSPSESPDLVVNGATVGPGDTASLEVVLSEVPEGLAGFELTLGLETADVGSIRGGEYPDHFGMTTEPTVGVDRRTVTIEAADLEDEITPGATGVTLATVDVEGTTTGDTAVRVTEARFDADGGARIDPSVATGTLTVSDDSTADSGSTARGLGNDDALAGFGTAAAVVGILGLAVAVVFVRDQ